MKELLEAQSTPQSGILVRELLVDMRDWRASAQHALRRFSSEPGKADHGAFRSRLDARLNRLEARIQEALDTADQAIVSTEERRNMYSLLGAYRGLSEALVDLANQMSPIDWARLRAARF
jgi:hypothetical protein